MSIAQLKDWILENLDSPLMKTKILHEWIRNNKRFTDEDRTQIDELLSSMENEGLISIDDSGVITMISRS